MKTENLSKLTRVHWLLLGLVLLGAAVGFTTQSARRLVRQHAQALGAALLFKTWTTAPTATTAQTAPANATFTVRSYGGKCLEFGVPRTPIRQTVARGYPVFISDCKGTAVQQVRIEELSDRPGHLVILRAGNGVIGKKLDVVVTQQIASEAQGEDRAAEPASSATLNFTSIPDQTPLEVQPYTGSEGQIFALDGDSIILAADRNLVVEVQNNRGANGTPLVLGLRDLDDAEFWTFAATDGSNRRPTSGFVRVPVNGAIDDAVEFAEAVRRAQPGTVVEVHPDASIELTSQGIILIGKGVTIRGDRRGTRPGPELWTKPTADITMLAIDGDDVRITGLRVRGPSASTDGDGPNSRGILARDDYQRSIIDHNEISNWTHQAVDAYGDGAQTDVCRDHRDPKSSRQQNVRVARNFIHHNQKQEKGYGVQAHYGGFPLIEGNTFAYNRHSIMADGKACTSYRAYYNLVLSRAPCQTKAGFCIWYTQDFDVHGTGDNGFGGRAGKYFEIARNTFLGTNRENFDLRGEPLQTVEYHHNISLRSLGDAIKCSSCGDINKLRVYDSNQFNAPNPTNRLGVGDFDGDGKDDMFLATGAAWYYAPSGKTEWRFLNARTEKLESLQFGDFDGDKRTDVFTQHGMNWDVSWAGASKWEKINQSTEPMSGYYIADFDGDLHADVFYANGHEWFISFRGISPFTHIKFDTHRTSDLRFGDFTGDGMTDVFGIVGNYWMAVYSDSAPAAWVPLRPKLTDSVADLIVVDFNGDGRADVATLNTPKVSWSGTSDWVGLRLFRDSPVAAIGRFDDNAGADILQWHGDIFFISSGGTGAPRISGPAWR